MRVPRAIVLLMLAQGLAGCGGAGSPSPVPAPTPPRLVLFTDHISGLSTPDVRDVQDQIVRFNTAAEVIWTADDTRFPGYVVDGNSIKTTGTCASCTLLVRFGTKGGERRAYLTFPDNEDHSNAVTILDVEVADGRLVITNTSVRLLGY
jgi:hypothetical protein